MSGLLLTSRVDVMTDPWVLSLLSSVANHFGTLEVGIAENEGRKCLYFPGSLITHNGTG